jgi:hypothetical protein
VEQMMRAAREDLLGFTEFPQLHWRKIWSTDESVNWCAGLGDPAMGASDWRPAAAVKVERPTGRTTLTAARTAVAFRDRRRGCLRRRVIGSARHGG